MEQNLDLSTYELLSSYDKLILKKENELQKYFFENVKQEDMTGDIELPLIYSEDSDYAKLRRIKPTITSEVAILEKKINDPEKYLINNVIDNLNVNGLSKEEREEAIKKGLELEVEKAKNKKEKYDLRLKTMEEEPKLFLRYYEFKNSDFSIVEDEDVRKKLHEMQTEINEYKKRRNAILGALKDSENAPKML